MAPQNVQFNPNGALPPHAQHGMMQQQQQQQQQQQHAGPSAAAMQDSFPGDTGKDNKWLTFISQVYDNLETDIKHASVKMMYENWFV